MLTLLFTLLVAAAGLAVTSAQQKTFGMGYSQYQITSVEQNFFNHTLTSGFATLTHFWATGSPSPLIDAAIWSYYLDGESTPSIQFTSQMVAGTGFPEPHAPWGHRWFGKGSADAGWYNNFRVPFTKSIRITGRLPYGSATLWAIFRGTENLPISIGGFTLPSSARLIQQRLVNATFEPLDWVTVLDVPSGSGLLFSHTLAVTSGNLNFLEGCYHAYTPHSALFPGLTVSTGTEDYFDSAFYFNAGQFRQENAGLTHMFTNNSVAEVSAYRMHHEDPIFFADGFRFLWRNGDVSDGAGHKCTLEKGGSPAGDPQRSVVNAHTWAYVWAPAEAEATPHAALVDS